MHSQREQLSSSFSSANQEAQESPSPFLPTQLPYDAPSSSGGHSSTFPNWLFAGKSCSSQAGTTVRAGTAGLSPGLASKHPAELTLCTLIHTFALLMTLSTECNEHSQASRRVSNGGENDSNVVLDTHCSLPVLLFKCILTIKEDCFL